jgi:hypothetical protein
LRRDFGFSYHEGVAPSSGSAADIPPPTLLYEVPGEFVHFAWNNVELIVWSGTASAAGVQRLSQASTQRARELKVKVSYVHVVAAGAGLPDADARGEFKQLRIRTTPWMACFVCVIESDGFWASAMRGLVTSLMTLQGERVTMKILGSLAEAAAWLPEPHARLSGIAIAQTQLMRVLEFARASRP